MARTFVEITGSGVGGAFANDDPLGYKRVEKIRQDLDLLAYIAGHLDLGGDNTNGIISSSYVAVNSARAYTLDGDNLGGLTLEAVVWYRTFASGTSVQVRVRNTTDSSNAGAGTLSTSTTVVREVITLTLASGAKDYELQVQGGNTDADVYAWGYLRLRKVPA